MVWLKLSHQVESPLSGKTHFQAHPNSNGGPQFLVGCGPEASILHHMGFSWTTGVSVAAGYSQRSKRERTPKMQTAVFHDLILEVMSCTVTTPATCFWSQRPTPVTWEATTQGMSARRWGSLGAILEAGYHPEAKMLSEFRS